ncbi:hypothetical protein [Mycolicibacterium sp. F2034L]|uniref:hypothetical protein n=1 Tax=Mycolicibacterium sp. F2034L TaxID=2926422 RepID=UPI001FF3E300|nr:hypothetical protein [Mycolicibacterium sp. F2034L]MCK0172585.1 hypothetical protein [Mycolicibacterium sp. F2034L]
MFAARAQLLSALVALGFAVFALGLVSMLLTVAIGKVAPRVVVDGDAVTVRPDRKVDGLLTASIVGALIAMAVYAVFAPMRMLDIEVAGRDQRYFVIVCAAAVVVGLFTLRQIIRRRGTSYLRLDAEGLETGNTMTSVQRRWEDVTEVADRPRNGRRSTGAVYLLTGDGHSREIPSSWYTPGGQALGDYVRFYWQHPEARDELSDSRAVERLKLQSRGNPR